MTKTLYLFGGTCNKGFHEIGKLDVGFRLIVVNAARALHVFDSYSTEVGSSPGLNGNGR